MEASRTANSIKNSIYSVLGLLSSTIITFVSRTVFIYVLGKTYLGFNGLFSNVLSLLSLAELGIGTAITYSMYQPVAENNIREIRSLLGLYQKVYRIVGGTTLAIGILLIPLLPFFISDIPDIPHLTLIYLLYLANSVVSYFFSYKFVLLRVYQKDYLLTRMNVFFQLVQMAIQVAILLVFRNFILYLFTSVICTVLWNFLITQYINRAFLHIVNTPYYPLENDVKQKIVKSVKAMFISNLSSVIVTNTDNLLISSFVSTILLGYYSNYLIFLNMARSLLNGVFGAITGSVGNLVNSKTSREVYQIFSNIWFINYYLIALASSCLFVMVNDFIRLWIGSSYLLAQSIVLMFFLNMYIRYMRNTLITFNTTYGHFIELKWAYLAEALINLVASLLFVWGFQWGVLGVLFGTFMSSICTNFWTEPTLLFRKFGISVWQYFYRYAYYFIVLVISTGAMYLTCHLLLPSVTWPLFIIKCVLCLGIFHANFYLAFRRLSEFRYLLSIVKLTFHRFISR